MLAEDKD